ncbi:MAG TPA: ABC transporter permease, partial [Rhodothermales bacterium]|nr:ABC transporter permease [Rhodothermales bacterium]
MLKNYLKVSLRTLRKHKGYSFINVAGLALGLACCVLMLLFVQDERSYDRFHEHADRIYRVTMDAQPPNAPMDRFAITSRPVGTALRAEYPEVEHLVRLNNWNPVIQHEGTYFYDDQTLFAEPEIFDVFSFPLVEGDPETALNEPNSLVLTETTAQKYFGTDRALGQSLTLNDTLTFNVTGVMADIPTNSHFTTDILVSYATLDNLQPENPEAWLSLGGYTYLLLEDGVSASAFEQKMSDLVTRHFGETLQEINFAVTLGLQPLTSIHLHSDR